jgi:primosomal protein N' (replication factor Y)
MHVIEVIPLKRGVHVPTLTYFSSIAYEFGSIISVPIRNSETPAVVVDVKEVSTAKTALRAATFSLKKLPAQRDVQKISPALLATARDLADRYAAQTGAVLFSLLAPEIRSGDIPLPHTHHPQAGEERTPTILQADTTNRYISYRSLVRETFSHGGSLLFVVPSSAEIEEARERLSTGISERVITLSSAMTSRQLREAYDALSDFTCPKLIITSPSHALIERHDVTATVIEHGRSNYYKDRQRPYLDHRDVLIMHAKHTGREVVIGDLLPRTEEESLRREEVYATLDATPKRLSFPGAVRIIKQNDKPSATTPFRLFSPKVIEALQEVLKNRQKAFLLAARRGLAPVVACGDCGHIFRSPNAGSPYSLVRTKNASGEEERWFVCSVSGQRERAADTCPECGSWRLRERGIGIQYAHDELSRELGGEPLMTFDHLSAKTYKRACFLRDTFYKKKGVIMLGTPMAIPYLSKPYDMSVVINLDALRATPTWRQQEENLALLLRLREQTTGSVFIQTRSGSDDIVEHARRGSVEKFYNEEIELRKTFNYPPYTVFILLTWQGTKEIVAGVEREIQSRLEGTEVTFYSAPPISKGQYIRHGLIRYPSMDWPNAQIVQALRQLPPSVRIVLNPDRII